MYECKFPNCGYQTDVRSQISHHHIKPKELGGSNHKSNLIYLCPTHHAHVYIEGSKSGIHSIQGNDSIIIRALYGSTDGLVMEYEQHGEIKYHFLDSVASSDCI